MTGKVRELSKSSYIRRTTIVEKHTSLASRETYQKQKQELCIFNGCMYVWAVCIVYLMQNTLYYYYSCLHSKKKQNKKKVTLEEN